LRPDIPTLQYSNTPFFFMRHPSLIALSHDHHHGLALALRCRKQALGQLKPTGVEGLRIRAQEFREFFDKQLTPHFRAEEEVLFPFMRETAPQSSALLDDLVREHATFRQAVEKLAGGTALSKMIFDLGDLLERHIRREERELFPLFEEHAHGDRAEIVGQDIKKILEQKSEG
jgi:iron-sulfur cluster repair protein YtfE (RIC family)